MYNSTLKTTQPLRRDLIPSSREIAPWKIDQLPPRGSIDTSGLDFGMRPRTRERIQPHSSLTIRKGYTHCEWCGEEIELPQEPHHIISRGSGGPDHEYNLVMLCGKGAMPGTCHGDAHGKCQSNEILTKAMLAARHAELFPEIQNGAHLLEEIDNMRTHINQGTV